MSLPVLVKRLALESEQESVALYGSRAVSLILGREVASSSDVDVAILGGRSEALAANRCLTRSGYVVSPWLRRFRMNRRDVAWIFEATRGEWKFDVTAVQSFDLLGQFSVERLWIEIPSETVVDNGASAAIRKRLLSLSTPLELAVPHLLLARLLVLASFYDLPLGTASRNGRMVETILHRCRDAQGALDEEDARASALSALFRATLRAKSRKRFLTTISRAGITALLGETVARLLAASALRDAPGLERLSRREELAELIMRNCGNAEVRKLAAEIGILRLRKWNEGDLRIASMVEQRAAQKS